ncbi:DNA-3-methyladenine glycosylase 1, partial [Dissophora ornata]
KGAQAGLSWSTILHKRDAYRQAYDHFDYNVIADTYTSPASNERLLQTNIVKNKLKVEASIVNAKLFRDLLNELYPDQAKPEDENGFWQFLQAYKHHPNTSTTTKTGGSKKAKKDNEEKEVPQAGHLTSNEASDRLSADLKKRGFKFVGTTIMYSYLQAIGIELEGTHHIANCFMHFQETRELPSKH